MNIRSVFFALVAFGTYAPPLTTFAQTEFPAVLAGHAFIPAQTFIAAPKDAPADLQFSGKFTTGQRVDRVGGRQVSPYLSAANPFKATQASNA
jgi:hypothetical protein